MADLYDPRSPAFQADPYPALARMRERGPVHVHEFDRPDGSRERVWVLTRWSDCVALLRDPRMTAEKDVGAVLPLAPPAGAEAHPLVRTYLGMMLFRDPPDHTRLRTLVSKAFTPRRVERLRPRVQALVDELLEAAAPAGPMDLVADLAVPLPIIVIAELLGVPVEDRERLKVWSDHVAMLLDGTLREEHLDVALPSFGELVDYLQHVVEARRKQPQDDLVSSLVAAQDADDRLDDFEVLGTCVLILGAGHETTTNLIGNGALALLRDRRAWERLGREPGLVPSAVEELLRFDSPVSVTSRLPREDVVLHGHRIPKGCEINAVIASANRDAERFADPDRLVLDRSDNRHLAFGQGAHFCLGAPLARLEGRIALATLARRFPQLALVDDDPPLRPGFVLRGRTALPVQVG